MVIDIKYNNILQIIFGFDTDSPIDVFSTKVFRAPFRHQNNFKHDDLQLHDS